MMKAQVELSKIALDVAMDAKASGMGAGDLGCFYDDDWNLSDAEWHAVVERVAEIYDGVEPSTELRRSWAKVNADWRSEQRAERRVCYGEQAYFNDL